jgi:hypothetical protein
MKAIVYTKYGPAVDSQIDSRLRTSLEALTGGKLVKRQVDQTLDSQVDIFAKANKYRSFLGIKEPFYAHARIEEVLGVKAPFSFGTKP